MEEDKLLCELTDAEWDDFKIEYKKYWEEHKEELQKYVDALSKVIAKAVRSKWNGIQRSKEVNIRKVGLDSSGYILRVYRRRHVWLLPRIQESQNQEFGLPGWT